MAMNELILSENLDSFKGVHCTLGIDEAGRGPALGPMVYAVCVCHSSALDRIDKLNARDSKQLNEAQRDLVFEKLKGERDAIGYGMKVLSAAFISSSMLKRLKYNLNHISHDAAIELIEAVEKKGILVDKVILDTVGPPEAYKTKLTRHFGNMEIVVSKKADSLYPVVSAASVCAKVTRDERLKNWPSKNDNLPRGSGYPSDPVTIDYLQKCVDPVFGYDQLVRFSWSTVREVLSKRGVATTWEDEEDEDDANIDQPNICDFFLNHRSSVSKRRHVFFEERNLSNASDF